MSAEGEKLRWRARWVFAGQTRSLLDTGRLMARWAEDAAGVLAPELEWVAQVREQLRRGQASVVFDDVTETISIFTREQLDELDRS